MKEENLREIHILEAKQIQAKNKRYGIRLFIAYSPIIETNFCHTIWLGNYKDFQEDTKAKSETIWYMAITAFEKMQIDPSFIYQPEKLTGNVFQGRIKTTTMGITLNLS